MKKIIDGRIIDTAKGERIACRGTHHNYNNDPMGWESIELVDSVYYLETRGGSDLRGGSNDIFPPEDDIDIIGQGCADALMPWLASHEEWAMEPALIAHIEQTMTA